MALFNIAVVNTYPSNLAPSTLYIKKSAVAGQAEYLMSDVTGTAGYKNLSSEVVELMIQAALNDFNTFEAYPNYTAMVEASSTFGANRKTVAIDASTDTTVTSGAAGYIWTEATSSFTKVWESESLDISMLWDNISDGPASTPAQVDDAVAATHTHSNKAVIDELTDVSNVLHYKGLPVSNVSAATHEW